MKLFIFGSYVFNMVRGIGRQTATMKPPPLSPTFWRRTTKTRTIEHNSTHIDKNLQQQILREYSVLLSTKQPIQESSFSHIRLFPIVCVGRDYMVLHISHKYTRVHEKLISSAIAKIYAMNTFFNFHRFARVEMA